jgi:hypothetical protein
MRLHDDSENAERYRAGNERRGLQMKNRLIMVSLLIMVIVLLFASCSQPGMPDYLVGGVHLTVAGSCDEVCALLEQALSGEETEFQLIGTGPRGYSVQRTHTKLPWAVHRLPVGSWTLQFSVQDAVGDVVLQGNSMVEVRPGSVDELIVTLSLPTAENQVSSPMFSPAPGTISSSQPISLSCATPDAMIHYTLDGSEPTASSTRYTAPFLLGASAVVKAIAVKEGMSSSVPVQASYTLAPVQVATPTISASESTFASQATVNLACATEGASIHYTLDGTTPTSSSALYTAPLPIFETTTIKAIAIKSGWEASSVAQATYTKQSRTATPVITPAGSVFTGSLEIRITAATADSVIHYTLDGSIPSASSPTYTGPILLTDSAVVKAIAVKQGMLDSLTASESYTLRTTVADPVFSPEPVASGFNAAQSVTISCQTIGAAIHYTSAIGDAVPSDPNASSPLYSGAITVGETTTIKAIAVKVGCEDSAVVTKTFVINGSIIIEF